MAATPRPPQALLQAATLLGLAGLGAGVGAGAVGAGLLGVEAGLLPDMIDRPGWSLGAGLVLAAGVGGWMWWRQRGQQRRLDALRLDLAAPAPPMAAPPGTTMEGVLRFATTAPLAWCARRGEWCLDLQRSGPADLPWRMNLRRADLPEEPVPLAQAATLDAVLHLSRRLFAQRALVRSSDATLREAAELLECDLEFLLPAAQSQMTALAEGGYALQDEKGCRAISAQLADTLLAHDIARRQAGHQETGRQEAGRRPAVDGQPGG
ncbi:hypothetical protein [Roseomonas sp. 18066]|uniref:hypothetical protein n=1 Tax=Roseomonas sp. 18066 TaxID=2681412 RepID=UPI00135920A4|nr:hypothetical protein [Roseomonas sp. 18066]